MIHSEHIIKKKRVSKAFYHWFIRYQALQEIIRRMLMFPNEFPHTWDACEWFHGVLVFPYLCLKIHQSPQHEITNSRNSAPTAKLLANGTRFRGSAHRKTDHTHALLLTLSWDHILMGTLTVHTTPLQVSRCFPSREPETHSCPTCFTSYFSFYLK